MTVAGWHMAGERPALAVSISANGIPVGVGAVGSVERVDVATALDNDDAAGSGWSVDVDLAPIVGDEVRLEVAVWEAPGTTPTTLAPISVLKQAGGQQAGAVVGVLDLPADGDVVSGDVLEVSGWCLFEGTHVARVELVVDGVRKGLVRPFVDRPDVAERFGHVDAPVAGFEAFVGFEGVDRAATSLVTVEATTLDGQRWRSPTRTVHWAVPATATAGPRHPGGARRPLLEGVTGGGSRVLVVAHDLSYGGGQLWLLELLRQVRACSTLDVMVVSMCGGPLRQELERLGVAVHVTAPVPVGDADAYEGRVDELALMMRSCGAGVVLANTLGMFAAVDAAERAGVPAVWAIHESFDPASYRRICWGPTAMDPQVAARFNACFQSARALVFEAHQTAELFAGLCSPEQRFVVDYGVDVDEIDAYRRAVDRAALRRAAGFGDDDVVLLVVGVVEPRKAQAAVVVAFDELARVHRNLRLALVGSCPTSYDAGIRARVERSAAAGRVDVLPITSEIYPWYAAADVLVCASDVESLPRSILEAMAFGLPVVSTDVFGIADLIEDGRTGWLTRDRDLEGLVGLLHLVLRLPPEERRSVGARARQEVRGRHGEQGYGRIFARALDALIEDPAGDPAPVLTQFDGDATSEPEVWSGPRDNG